MKQATQNAKKEENTKFLPFEEDFIPYATHINERTIITKNLHIIQTIKVNNFLNRELHHDAKHITLREFLRTAIQNNIKSDDFAFWIHTIRRTAKLDELLTNDGDFHSALNQTWTKFNKFDKQFANELYVSIILKGPEIKDKDVLMKYFTDLRLKNFIEKEINERIEKLTNAVDGMMKDLSLYSPNCLKIKQENGIYYSENIAFLNKLLNLIDVKIDLDEADISSVLSLSALNLRSNRINIKNDFGSNSVGIITLKHYLETNPTILDKILVLPFEFIVCQAFDFINFADVFDKYYAQYSMLKVSKDYKMMSQLGFDKNAFSDIEKANNLEYGENQISIIVIAKNEDSLNSEMSQIITLLHETGFVFVREDVAVEESFFASIPANFYYLKRMQPIQTNKIGGFASIDSHPIGKLYHNTWGEAVCLFKSNEGYPFFFNFHDSSDVGNTIFFGKDYDVKRTALTNFLIYQSLKFRTRIINIDNGATSKLLNLFVGGKYKYASLKKDQNNLFLNPVQLFSNHNAFANFIRQSLDFHMPKSENLHDYIKEKLMPFLIQNEGKFADLKELISIIDNEKIVKQFFHEVSEGGIMNHIFNSNQDDILSLKAGDFLSINISKLIEESQESVEFLLSYLINAILQLTQDKVKTILKIDSFLELFLNCGMPKKAIISTLEKLKNNNVVLIGIERYSFFQEYETEEEDEEIIDLFSTQIYNPAFVNYGVVENNISNNYLKNIVSFAKLTEHERDLINHFAFQEDFFVLKHADKVISLEFNADFSEVFYFLLAGFDINDDYLVGLKSATNFNDKFEEMKLLYSQFSS